MNVIKSTADKKDVRGQPVDIKKTSMQKLLTVSDVADWLQVSRRTIRDWVYRRKIPFMKVRNCLRFDQRAIRGWLGVTDGNPEV